MIKRRLADLLETLAKLLRAPEREHRRRIERSGLFDAEWYLARHPDAKRHRGGALGHYLAGGWSRGCSPGPAFDVPFYLATYPDILAAGIEPVMHYLDYGRAEGRRISPLSVAAHATSGSRQPALPRAFTPIETLALDPFLAFLADAGRGRDVLFVAPASQPSLESLIFLLASGARSARLLLHRADPAEDALFHYLASCMKPGGAAMAAIERLARIGAPRFFDPVWREVERLETWCVTSDLADADLANRAGRVDVLAMPGRLAVETEPLRLLISAARLGGEIVIDVPITPGTLPGAGAAMDRLAREGLLFQGDCDAATRVALSQFWRGHDAAMYGARSGPAESGAMNAAGPPPAGNWQWFFTYAGVDRLLSIAGLERFDGRHIGHHNMLLIRCRLPVPSACVANIVQTDGRNAL